MVCMVYTPANILKSESEHTSEQGGFWRESQMVCVSLSHRNVGQEEKSICPEISSLPHSYSAASVWAEEKAVSESVNHAGFVKTVPWADLTPAELLASTAPLLSGDPSGADLPSAGLPFRELFYNQA